MGDLERYTVQRANLAFRRAVDLADIFQMDHGRPVECGGGIIAKTHRGTGYRGFISNINVVTERMAKARITPPTMVSNMLREGLFTTLFVPTLVAAGIAGEFSTAPVEESAAWDAAGTLTDSSD